MTLEMIVGRVLTPYFGSSLIVWASVIAVTLLAMSLGYLIGGTQADKSKNIRPLARNIINAGIYISICAYYLSHIESVSSILSNTFFASLFGAAILLFVPCYFLSTYSPFVLKLSLDNIDSTGKISGRLYSLATVGSIFGTLFTSFILINNFNLDFLYMMTGLLTLVCGISLLLDQKFKMISFFLYVCLVVIYCFNIQREDPVEDPMENVGQMKNGIIDKAVSHFSNIYILKKNNNIYMRANLKKDEGYESGIDLYHPEKLLFKYNVLLTYSVIFPDKLDNILVLGLGGGTASTYLKRHLQKSKFEVVEIDDQVIKFGKKYFNVVEDEQYKIFNQDARLFLSKTNKRYDLILQDTYRGQNIPFHLTTKEYFSKVKSKLTSNGCFATNMATYKKDLTILHSQITTLKSVFENSLALAYNGNYILISCNSKNLNMNNLAKAAKLQDEYLFYYPLTDYPRYIESTLHIHGRVFTDNFTPLNLVSI